MEGHQDKGVCHNIQQHYLDISTDCPGTSHLVQRWSVGRVRACWLYPDKFWHLPSQSAPIWTTWVRWNTGLSFNPDKGQLNITLLRWAPAPLSQTFISCYWISHRYVSSAADRYSILIVTFLNIGLCISVYCFHAMRFYGGELIISQAMEALKIVTMVPLKAFASHKKLLLVTFDECQ